VLELFAARGITGVKVKCLGIQDEFVEQGTQAELRRAHGIDEEAIIDAARQMLTVKDANGRR